MPKYKVARGSISRLEGEDSRHKTYIPGDEIELSEAEATAMAGKLEPKSISQITADVKAALEGSAFKTIQVDPVQTGEVEQDSESAEQAGGPEDPKLEAVVGTGTPVAKKEAEVDKEKEEETKAKSEVIEKLATKKPHKATSTTAKTEDLL